MYGFPEHFSLHFAAARFYLYLVFHFHIPSPHTPKKIDTKQKQRMDQFKIVQTTLPLRPVHATPHQTMFHIKNRELAPNAVSYSDPFSHLIILEKWAERQQQQQQNANFNIFLPPTFYLLFGAGDQHGGNHRAEKCMEADVLHFWHRGRSWAPLLLLFTSGEEMLQWG